MSHTIQYRLLGLKDGGKTGFWRHVVGQAEKWLIIRANVSSTNNGHAYQAGVEDVAARGQYVRYGDTIMLQTMRGDLVLAMTSVMDRMSSSFEPASLSISSALHPGLVAKERAGQGRYIGHDPNNGGGLFTLQAFDSVPLPAWLSNRPYLSGRALLLGPTARQPPPEVENRVFPLSASTSAGQSLLWGHQNSLIPLGDLSAVEQQAVLMREVLLLCSPAMVEGAYLRGSMPSATVLPKLADMTLVFDTSSNGESLSLGGQVRDALIPLCTQILRIREYLAKQSRFEYGAVAHALCGEMKRLLREFDVLACQLECLLNQSKLTLQKMLFLLRPAVSTVFVMYGVCLTTQELIGGQLLSALFRHYQEQGDAKARLLVAELLRAAAAPWLNMLGAWLHRGELRDPCREFMVSMDEQLTKEALAEDFNAPYWEGRYKLSLKHVPYEMLLGHDGREDGPQVAERALLAGKYLNVLKDCLGDHDMQTLLTHGDVNFDEGKIFSSPPLILYLDGSDSNGQEEGSSIVKIIDAAYQHSSRLLLSLLQSRYGLTQHLQSLGRFFLLDHGDFFLQFMDLAEDELRRDVNDISVNRVRSLLQMAIMTSTVNGDVNKDKLSCAFAGHNLTQHLHLIQMAGSTLPGSNNNSTALNAVTAAGGDGHQGLKGIEALVLDYQVGWPVSIVLSRRAITKYQLLARLLFFSKHVERRLLQAWSAHQMGCELEIRRVMGGCYTLRHRMLHFVQNFVYYITLEVITPRSAELYAELDSVGDMDMVLELHERFLDSCLKECLLAQQELLKPLTKLMTTALLFADHMLRFMQDALLRANSAIVLSNSTQLTVAVESRPLSKKQSSSRGLERKRSSKSMMASGTAADETYDGVGKKAGEEQAIVTKAHLDVERRRNCIAQQSASITADASHEAFTRILAKFEVTFDSQLKEFLDGLWSSSYRQHAQLANLCVRLDYNGYYSSTFATDT